MAVSNPTTSQVISAGESYRQQRFPQVFEAAAIGIALCHFDGRIMEGNAELARILRFDGGPASKRRLERLQALAFVMNLTAP